MPLGHCLIFSLKKENAKMMGIELNTISMYLSIIIIILLYYKS